MSSDHLTYGVLQVLWKQIEDARKRGEATFRFTPSQVYGGPTVANLIRSEFPDVTDILCDNADLILSFSPSERGKPEIEVVDFAELNAEETTLR